ncbi:MULTISPECIES: tyrosine-type recombinase/integrase [Nocardia]|uniref:tyrosine-type recombinase/integrase n=1 Tax=Nocardia TaxID=1817 RepID=UPI002457DA15|nr:MULTISPECIES: tyrosine-type recombinase/integrase [Nocardia]
MPESSTGTTTGHIRRHRHGPVLDELGFASRFVSGRIEPRPATTTTPPRPVGELSTAPIDRIAELVTITWDGAKPTRQQRGQATKIVLSYLSEFGGDTWQTRWDASPLGRGETTVSEVLGSRRGTGLAIGQGVRSLFCLRVIQPSLLAFRANSFHEYWQFFVAAQGDPLLEKFAEQTTASDLSWPHRRDALFDVCCLLTVQGVSLSDLTPAALLHYGHETRRVRTILQPETKMGNRFAGPSAWNVLHQVGHFPPGTPSTMREALSRGQLTIEQLVDRYPIRNRSVRQLLIDYFTRRAADSDYASISHMVLEVAHHFWEKIERINPDQADLRVSPEVYATWRHMISTREDGKNAGKPRAGVDGIVICVRSFYFDLHTWATDEPERWAQWVAPCPVPPSEIRGLGKRRRRINERSADRTRLRQPLLPLLVQHVESRYDTARTLLEHARRAQPGERFRLDGRSYQRVLTNSDVHTRVRSGGKSPVRILDEDTAAIVHIENDEEAAFWDWACVETLRHSGVRIEELCELTHLSIRQYQRSNSEVIALLVIAPSKTDRERVIPMSAELFHVIASVIRRHTQDGRSIPLASRFDHHDKVWSAQLPFLFQRRIGSTDRVIASGTVLNMLKRRCVELAEQHPGFRTTRFTPHDFRRIFATDLVNSGLPIHIGAALLGHLDIQTTRGYVAVFDEDIVRHYVAFLDHRRELRPVEEYRDATTEEWAEFDEHFDKRKVELGSCGRPYGTPCQHEHACIRCPVLHINPQMLARLDELETDLLARRARAETENWAGEVEGIDMTLTFLRAKRDDTQRRLRRPTVALGLPTPARSREQPGNTT